MGTIYKRAVIDEILPYLNDIGIIVLHGARQVGKTSILSYLQEQLRNQGKIAYFIDLEDSRFVRILDGGIEAFRQLLREEGISVELGGKAFVFIDEIQYLANPSSFLKLLADHHGDIKLIVSGSSSFAIQSKFQDSLAGRTVDFTIFPLSFQEFLFFRDVPFPEGQPFTDKKNEELLALFREFVLCGGYPRVALMAETAKKERYLQQIIDTYVKKDIRDLAEVKDVDKFNRLLEVLASQSGQLLNIAELANTARIARATVERYLFILENTYILRLVRPFSRNLRAELFKLPKIFFYDTGLMQMLWLKGLPREVIGSVLETAVHSELAKRYGPEAVHYWRTQDKKEIDFILQVRDDILPIEVKMGFDQFNPSAIRYFNRHYNLDRYRVVALNGVADHTIRVYPWELERKMLSNLYGSGCPEKR